MNSKVTMNATTIQTYEETSKKTACYILNITNTNGLWQGENPLSESLPQFIIQLFFIILITRTLYLILSPFRIPPMVSDILGGIFLSFGRTKWFPDLFPLGSIMTIETLSYLALVFYMFLLGLRMDSKSLLRNSNRTITIAAVGIFISMTGGIGLYFLTKRFMDDKGNNGSNNGCFFWGIALSITGFPVVARILADLKLHHTEIGKIAMSIALVNDICALVLICIAIPIVVSPIHAASVVTSTVAFILLCIFAVRPLLVRITRRTSKSDDGYTEFYLCFILVGVVLCSFVTDVFGTHSIVGAFIFGVIWPDKEAGAVMIERFDDFVSGLMLPAYFAVSGIRVNVYGVQHWQSMTLILILACVVKILSTLLACSFFDMTVREGMTLGIIMNTKGILALVVLNQGWDKRLLPDEEYSVMLFAIVIMTTMVAPIIGRMYRLEKSISQYKFRTIERAKPKAELRILTCIHSKSDVSGIINLIDVTNTKKQSPICVLAVHLMELKGRASAMCIAHSTRKTKSSTQESNCDGYSYSEDVIHAFKIYQNLSTGITIQPYTAVSPFVTMHEEVCTLAEDKRISFMILPFQKQATLGSVIEEGNAAFHGVNQNILVNAPCSVGIFVDRGFSGDSSSNNNVKNIAMMLIKKKQRNIAMIFIGGPDDREALAFAWRIIGNVGVHFLTVLRLLPGDDVEEVEKIDSPSNVPSLVSSTSRKDWQRMYDDDYVNEFRLRTAEDQHVTYTEKVVNNSDELVAAIREMNHPFDLYIVGRGETIVSPLTVELLDWSDCLGPVGDMLVSSNFALGSVLVVQQYVGSADVVAVDVLSSPDRSILSGRTEKFGGSWKMPSYKDNEGFELYTRRSMRDGDGDGYDDEYDERR